jgi:hypothetical protein
LYDRAFTPAPNHSEEILQLLLKDEMVYVAVKGMDGNTALHLAARDVHCYSQAWEKEEYASAVRRFHILHKECVLRKLDFSITNDRGESVQQCVDEALAYIEKRLRTEHFFELCKVLLVGSAVAVPVLLARRYSTVAGWFGKAWNACGNQISKLWRGALKDQMW